MPSCLPCRCALCSWIHYTRQSLMGYPRALCSVHSSSSPRFSPVDRISATSTWISTAMLMTHRSISAPQPSTNPPLSHIDSCLSAIKLWMQHNFFKLNSEKNKLLLNSKSTLKKFDNLTLTIDGTTVSPSTQAHSLGVILDPTLALKPHIHHIVKITYKILPSSDPLLHAHCWTTHPRLRFLPSRLLQFTPPRHQCQLHQIIKVVQNADAQFWTHTKFLAPVTPVLYNLHWIPVSQWIIYKILTVTYEALYQLAPSYLSDLLKLYKPSRSLRSSLANLFSTSMANLCSFGDRPSPGQLPCFETPSHKTSETLNPQQSLSPTSRPPIFLCLLLAHLNHPQHVCVCVCVSSCRVCLSHSIHSFVKLLWVLEKSDINVIFLLLLLLLLLLFLRWPKFLNSLKTELNRKTKCEFALPLKSNIGLHRTEVNGRQMFSKANFALIVWWQLNTNKPCQRWQLLMC